VYQKFSSADEKNGERLIGVSAYWRNGVPAYELWRGEAPARPRQLLMAMMLNDDYPFWATRPPSRVCGVALVQRVESSRLQFGSCMLNRGLHILGRGSANGSALATIDSTSRVALRTI
jgi:hypothetical protein